MPALLYLIVLLTNFCTRTILSAPLPAAALPAAAKTTPGKPIKTTTVTTARPAAKATGIPAGCSPGEKKKPHDKLHEISFEEEADWSKLGQTCSNGHHQSPLNFHNHTKLMVEPTDPKVPMVRWEPYTNVEIEDLGHTIQVTVSKAQKATILSFLGKTEIYSLAQFHCKYPWSIRSVDDLLVHIGSEHHVDGHVYPAEAHFVFKTPAGNISVVGFFLTFGDDNTHSVFDQIIDNLAYDCGNVLKEKSPLKKLDLHELGDHFTSSKVFRYTGSLTTPPCTEGIEWTVVKKPIKVNTKVLEALYKNMPFNARPTRHTTDIHQE